MSRHQVAALFDLISSTEVKWTQRLRETVSVAAKPKCGKRSYLLEAHRDWLLARLRAKPDITLHALLEELERECQIVVSCDTL